MTRYYYIEKTSNTSADALLALGFASLLRVVLLKRGKRSKGIIIRDVGPGYEIELPTSISDDDLRQLAPFTLVRPIFTEKQADVVDGFDYQRFQQEAQSYYEQIKRLPPKYRTPEARLRPEFQQLDLTPPVPELDHYRAIQQMKIASSFNEVAQRWQGLGELQREAIRLLLTLFGARENDLAGALVSWQKLMDEHRLSGKTVVTQLQIVNPATGKGANRAKPGTLSEGNPDNFWLLELLKFLGFMDAAAPFVLQGSKDRKIYVLQPKSVELSTLQGMMKTFRAVCWASTAVKMDVIASLRFAQVFIELREQSLKGMIQDEDELVTEEQLYSIAAGFEATSYKDMGSAYATINMASINLPQWIPRITTAGEAASARELLEEHLNIVQHLRTSKGEEGAEEYELLRFYRNFVSGRDLKPFWQFTTAYSSYLMSQREREKDPRKQIRQFTRQGLENLLTMSTQGQRLSTITNDPGFKRIAYAIRQSTVWAQFRRAQLRDRTYEVRYGLGQELMREARYEKKFLVVLSTFLQQYNAETAREEEKVANRLGRKLTAEDRKANNLRGSVSHSDIDHIVALVDTFDSETVCALLVAYGYASDPRKEAAELGTVVPNQPEDVVETELTDTPAQAEVVS